MYTVFEPDPRLQGLVRMYTQIIDSHSLQPQEHRFVPEDRVRLTFSTGDSWQGLPTQTELSRMPDALLIGLTLTPQRMVSSGLTRTLEVELYPWGARQLFGWSMGAPPQDLSLTAPWLARAICALLRLDAWQEARQMAEDWLLSLLAERGRESTAGIQAAGELYRSLGKSRIQELAEQLGVSQRHLERLFVQDVGINAKTLARLIRFDEAHGRLWVSPDTSLATLAYDLGFSDQAHLTREFRALADMTPAAFSRYTILMRSRQSPEEQHFLQLVSQEDRRLPQGFPSFPK